MPPIEEYQEYVKDIWKTDWLTNQGPLLLQFEKETKKYLNIKNFHFVANGTLALQLAIRALGITDGEIITTPFSYVASSSAILWQGCDPVFVDIDPVTLCIDPGKIEAVITNKTRAILAVHVFGNPCDLVAIDAIAKRHKLKVIYDAAHAFAVTHENTSIYDYGDISTGSFHATKLFHTIEGGCLVVKDDAVSETVELMKRFGHNGDDHKILGVNAKASEFNAAMGLCNLKYIDEIIAKRKIISEKYDMLLGNYFDRPAIKKLTKYNYSYYPVIFETEASLLGALKTLVEENVFPRRYFYPSLNTLPYIKDRQKCPISEDISRRIVCLPLYDDLPIIEVERISKILLRALRK